VVVFWGEDGLDDMKLEWEIGVGITKGRAAHCLFLGGAANATVLREGRGVPRGLAVWTRREAKSGALAVRGPGGAGRQQRREWLARVALHATTTMMVRKDD
jgi:hypothetical protein